uniref:Uncharacterized protein n=1 Tax=Utricularia reniformis TaxID=192314 RepID=A0A1Y0B493_9LAMI|nr:hypothetical protein AEK19_MT1986 [Utricularia reniformis]ART32149.1 hypothetical protein AEK19_MT1986 [Utricularia reniformis]
MPKCHFSVIAVSFFPHYKIEWKSDFHFPNLFCSLRLFLSTASVSLVDFSLNFSSQTLTVASLTRWLSKSLQPTNVS